MTEPAPLRTPREVTREWHVPRDAVYGALRDGSLRAIRFGTRWLVPPWAVEEWLRQLAERRTD